MHDKKKPVVYYSRSGWAVSAQDLGSNSEPNKPPAEAALNIICYGVIEKAQRNYDKKDKTKTYSPNAYWYESPKNKGGMVERKGYLFEIHQQKKSYKSIQFYFFNSLKKGEYKLKITKDDYVLLKDRFLNWPKSKKIYS